MFSYSAISRSCVISEEAIKMFPVNFNQSWKRTNELNEALFWCNYGKSRKTLEKYTDKICDQILKEKCLKCWNVSRDPKHWMNIICLP